MRRRLAVNYKLRDSYGRGLGVHSFAISAPRVVSARCPHCHQMGSFAGLNEIPDARFSTWDVDSSGRGSNSKDVTAGLRKCPNAECYGLVFVILDDRGLQMLPPERLHFDPAGVPEELVLTLTEAVECHAARCYRASALMVRRLLEELCDAQGAKGKDLFERIGSLRSKILISEALITGAQQLRLLGNDAAHITAKTYAAIGREELEVAIAVAQRILEAVYQHADLVERLKKFAAAPPTPDKA